MIFQHLSIRNFRNFRELDIDLSNKNVIFGLNDIGKTNFLCAIRYLLDKNFRKNGLLDSDFHEKDISKTITITLKLDIADSGNLDNRKIYKAIKGLRRSSTESLYIQLQSNYSKENLRGDIKLFWGDDVEHLEDVPSFQANYEIDNIFNVVYIDSSVQLLSCIMVVIIVLSSMITTVFANSSGYCGDNIIWEYNYGTLTISGSGAMYDYSYPNQVPWFSLNASIVNIVIEDGITSLGTYSFYGMTAVENIYVGSDVTNIEKSALHQISFLNIEVSNENQQYSSVDGNLYDKLKSSLIRYATKKEIASFTVPDSVVSIKNNAFSNANNIVKIIVGANVTYIGEYAFEYCENLSDITFCENVTNISAYAFYQCVNLQKIIFPNSLKTIGENAFYGCEKISVIDFGENLTTIGSNAFYYCSNIETIYIKKGLLQIKDGAFRDCTNVKIYYTGSENDWNNIRIGIANYGITGGTVVYNYVYEIKENISVENVVLAENYVSVKIKLTKSCDLENIDLFFASYSNDGKMNKVKKTVIDILSNTEEEYKIEEIVIDNKDDYYKIFVWNNMCPLTTAFMKELTK